MEQNYVIVLPEEDKFDAPLNFRQTTEPIKNAALVSPEWVRLYLKTTNTGLPTQPVNSHCGANGSCNDNTVCVY